VSLLFLNGTCCCFEAKAFITSDNDDSEELMATCGPSGTALQHWQMQEK
jgi:hypothetical protein